MRTVHRGFVYTMAAALAMIVSVSCTSIAPVKVTAGDQCFRCRRPIIEVRLAGEMIDNNGFVSKFRAPGCMAKYLAAHPSESGAIYVTDYTTGKMMRPDSAVFVPVLLNRDTGERDYRAYSAELDADAAALELHVVPVRWTAVMAAAAD